MKILSLLLLFGLMSCSHNRFWKLWGNSKEAEVRINYNEFTNDDYVDHLKSFEKTFTSEYSKSVIKVSGSTKKYLSRIIENITKNNELFFEENTKPKFIIIKSKIPFHFSLPGRVFFLSSTLVKKYIKNEAMLYCMLAYELIRSEKNIYNKKIIIPTGTMSISRILSLLQINIEDKIEVHKWAFYLLRRSEVQVDNYLAWLQVKNRNSTDFAMQLGDIQAISREESLFKAFIIKNVKENRRNNKYKSSSRGFYRFINNLKRG